MYTRIHGQNNVNTSTHMYMHAHTQTCKNTGNPLTAGNKHLYQCVPIQQVGLHSNHDTTNISHTNNTTTQHHMYLWSRLTAVTKLFLWRNHTWSSPSSRLNKSNADNVYGTCVMDMQYYVLSILKSLKHH